MELSTHTRFSHAHYTPGFSHTLILTAILQNGNYPVTQIGGVETEAHEEMEPV